MGTPSLRRPSRVGASAIICETIPAELKEGVTYVRVEDAAATLGIMAANFFDHPSKQLKLVGITGTNGKTSTATLLFRLFRALGYKCGLISTVEIRIGQRTIPSTHTTPDAIRLNELLAEMVEEKVAIASWR
jgi:UDP-N-acetylmuramoyl-L-alanyl-D-glutamate--2,6-diaminopimelate ligase